MIRKALRRRASSFAFYILLGLLFTAGFIGSTYAYFDGEVDQTATYAGGYLVAPSGLAAPAALGYGAGLGWTPATAASVVTIPFTTTSGYTGPIVLVTTTLATAQALYGLDRGSNSAACPAFTDTTATYTVLTTNVTSTLATTTDAGSSAYNGHYYCYQVQATHGSWYQGAIFAGVQVGFFPISVTLSNANNVIANADKIVVVYNQNVTVAQSPITVAACPVVTGTTVAAGHTTTQYGAGTAVVGGTCGNTGSVGVIQNLTITSATKTFTNSAVVPTGTTVSKTVTITLNGGANVNVAAGSSGSFVPSGTGVKSRVGAATVCNCTTVSDSGGF